MWCQVIHHTFTPTIKHLITTIANKHPGKTTFIDLKKYEKIPLASSCAHHMPLLQDPLLKVSVLIKAIVKNVYNRLIN